MNKYLSKMNHWRKQERKQAWLLVIMIISYSIMIIMYLLHPLESQAINSDIELNNPSFTELLDKHGNIYLIMSFDAIFMTITTCWLFYIQASRNPIYIIDRMKKILNRIKHKLRRGETDEDVTETE